MIEIEYLVDVPYFLPVVSSWAFRQWHQGVRSLKSIYTEYRRRLSRDSIPLTLVAVEEGTPVGTISIELDDLPSRPDLFPWIGSLYVEPKFRKRGIGRMLVDKAQGIADDMGAGSLYVMTADLQELCEKEGWFYIGDEPYRNNKDVSIYGKKLNI
jgi:GNAT superfamily N-acetyltransferase